MPANTSKNITYPTGSDNVDNLKAVFATLASSVDTALNNYVQTANLATGTDVTAGTSTTKVVTPKALADAGIAVGDTGWLDVSSSVSAAPGFSKGSGFQCWARRIGSIAMIQVFDLRKASGNALAIPVNGNVANVAILTGVPAQFTPSRDMVPLSAGHQGRANSYIIRPNSAIHISAMVPASNQGGTVNCPTNEEFSVGGTYFL